MPDYKKSKITNDTEAQSVFLKALYKIHNATKDLSTRGIGLYIQALHKDKNIKGLIGRPEIHKVDSLSQVDASAREILQYMAKTGVGMKGVNTKIINPVLLLDDKVTKRMRSVYNAAIKKGFNHSSASALMALIQGETTSDNTDDLFNYRKIQRETAGNLNRIINSGLLSFENLRPTNADEKKKLGLNYVEDSGYNHGKYQKYLKDNKLTDNESNQLDYYLKYHLPEGALKAVNAMTPEDAATYLFKHQKTGKSIDPNNLKTLRERAAFYNKTKFNYGGMIKTLKGRPKRYDLGGARDNVNNVTGSHWGAGKGIQGAETKSGLAKGLGIGSTVGAAAGSIVPGVGTAIGGVIGGIIGGVSGLISGIFGGRRKKRKAREAAIRADITKNYELGQDDIRIDQQALNDITINTNPIDIYGDNPIPTGNTQTVSNQYNMIGVPTKENYEFAFRCGGRRKRYADGGSINQVASNAAIVEGPSHEQGGVPYGANAEVEGGEAILNGSNADYIFSDTLKLGDRTFADIAKPLMLHKGYLEDKLAKSSVMLGGLLRLTDRSTYAIDRNTNARNTEKQYAKHNRLLAEINGVQTELNNLYNQQEAMKAEAGDTAEPKQEFALGGSIFACGGRRKYPNGGLAIPPLQFVAPTPQFAEMDIQTVTPITSTVNTGAMSGATMGANIIANFIAQDAMNKRQAVVSGLPPHIKDAVLSEVGMRCGGKVKKADGGSVQVSPFSDLNIQVNNPTKQMINPNPYLMTPMMLRRCGGKTKRYDLGGFISDESGNLIGSAGNLIGSLMQGRSKRKLAKSISDMPIPKREYLDNVNLEWDINTDAARREVIDQISAIEDFVKSNSSSASVARQAMLRARSKGASALGKLKQNELMQELNIRNQARQMNAEIAAKNKQIKYENEVDAFEKANLAASLLAEDNTGIRDALVGLTGDIQKMLNDHTLLNDKRNSNILHLLSNDKSIGFLKNLSDKQILRLFGKDAVVLKGKRCGGKVKKRYGDKRCA